MSDCTLPRHPEVALSTEPSRGHPAWGRTAILASLTVASALGMHKLSSFSENHANTAAASYADLLDTCLEAVDEGDRTVVQVSIGSLSQAAIRACGLDVDQVDPVETNYPSYATPNRFRVNVAQIRDARDEALEEADSYSDTAVGVLTGLGGFIGFLVGTLSIDKLAKRKRNI